MVENELQAAAATAQGLKLVFHNSAYSASGKRRCAANCRPQRFLPLKACVEGAKASKEEPLSLLLAGIFL